MRRHRLLNIFFIHAEVLGIKYYNIYNTLLNALTKNGIKYTLYRCKDKMKEKNLGQNFKIDGIWF